MTRLCQLVGIEMPIVQVPIGNASSPGLVAAVSGAGTLGMLSATWRTPAEIRRLIGEIRDLTDRPFGVNLVLEWEQDARLDTCLEEGVRIVSFFCGDPVRYLGRQFQDVGVLAVGVDDLGHQVGVLPPFHLQGHKGARLVELTDFEAMSFDCYGTLIDWEGGISAALRPWADASGLAMTDEELLTAYSAHEARAEAEHPTERYPRILARAMGALGAQLGVEVSEADAEAFSVSVPDWPAFPDSAEALQRLARRYELIILSNVDRTSFAGSNKRLGVTFAGVLTAEDIGSYKPAARNFEALGAEARRLGVGEDRLLHVAQSLFHDHAPAKAAGLPTAWINRRHDRPGWGATPQPPAAVTPDWTFTSMAALADAVDAEHA